MNLQIDNSLILATFSMTADRCGDTIQWLMRLLEPYIKLEIHSFMHDLSVSCYELGKLLLDKHSYKGEPEGLEEARDKVFLHKQSYRVSQRVNKGGL